MQMENELKEVLDNIGQDNSLALSTQERRVIIDDKVRNLILRGKSRPECLRFIKKESKRLGFEPTDSHCSNIFQAVKSSLKHEIEENHEELLADITSKLYWLYNQNIEKDDYKEARECIRDIAKLCGIGNNSVNIAKKDDTEVIQINFGFSE